MGGQPQSCRIFNTEVIRFDDGGESCVSVPCRLHDFVFYYIAWSWAILNTFEFLSS